MCCKKIDRVLFVHDGPVYQDAKGAYYGVGLNDALRERYLNIAKEVIFLMRVAPLKEADKGRYTRIQPTDFRVIEIPDFKAPRHYFSRRKQARMIVSEAVKACDAVIARLPSGAGSLAVEQAAFWKKPLLAEMVACTRDTYWYHSLLGKAIAPYFYLRQKQIMKQVRYCIYVTQAFLQRRYPIIGRSIACSNVELDTVMPELLPRRIERIKNSGTRESLLIGSVGNVGMRLKGHQDVIRALWILKKQGIYLRYHIVGGGNASRLNDLISRYKLEGQVRLLGALPHREVFAFMDSIDAYIQPSHTEGLPRAMVEAMSRGCPVLGARVGGIPELAHPDALFNPGAAGEIARLFRRLDKHWLIREASRSFREAGAYERTRLLTRRLKFYAFFLDEQNLTNR